MYVHILIYHVVDASQISKAPENSPPKPSASNKDDYYLNHHNACLQKLSSLHERLSGMKTKWENRLNTRDRHKEALLEEVNEASAQLKLASEKSFQKSSSVLLDEFSKDEGEVSRCLLELTESRRQLESTLDEARIGLQQCNVSVRLYN